MYSCGLTDASTFSASISHSLTWAFSFPWVFPDFKGVRFKSLDSHRFYSDSTDTVTEKRVAFRHRGNGKATGNFKY